jgi:hypothetical protein
MTRRHVVLLGSGASLAAFPNGDKHGRTVPGMPNLIEVVPGLKNYLETRNIAHSSSNIEDLYADLAANEAEQEHLTTIETFVFDYFALLEIPDEPTLYDHLVLSLCSKDMIATFNWDPFLVQAWNRVGNRIGLENLPRFVHLHGNVAEGHCDDPSHGGKMVVGPVGTSCSCGDILRGSLLLYPIAEKDYSKHPSIRAAWNDLRICLAGAYIFTVFGYGAPVTDLEAIGLLKDVWGNARKHPFDMVEVVDTAEESILRQRWEPFMPGSEQHFVILQSWYHTWLARNPRRSCEHLWDTRMRLQPGHYQPIPNTASWEELEEWVRPLLGPPGDD